MRATSFSASTFELDHRVELQPLGAEHRVERLGLRDGARKAVEDEALRRVGLARCARR